MVGDRKPPDSSRIAREIFWVLGKSRERTRKLAGYPADREIHLNHVLTLVGAFMLREEGVKNFPPSLLARETGIGKPVYHSCKWLVSKGIFNEEHGRYTCLARTPDFLLDPAELYGQEIEKVGDADYLVEKKIREFTLKFKEKIPAIVKEEVERIAQGNTAGNCNQG